jgi:hypothetical protein
MVKAQKEMQRKKKQYDDDDGRTIIKMDVEGMPWFNKSSQGEKSIPGKNAIAAQVTRSESRLYTWYAVLSGLLIAAVFSVTWILFTLFLTQIWSN